MKAKNILLDIKYIFLNFAQALFSTHLQFKWDKDIRNSKIIIVDRNAIDLGVAMQRPSIVLQRGDISWYYAVRGQDATNTVSYKDAGLLTNLGEYTPSGRMGMQKTYTDLLRGYIIFNVVSKSGVQTEILADHLFVNLTGFRDEFKRYGIKQFNNLSVSQEQLIKSNASPDLFGIQVSIGFVLQPHIRKNEKTYNCIVYIDENEYVEGHQFIVQENGNMIVFYDTPIATPKISYTEAVTLEQKLDVELIPTLDPLKFLLPTGDAVAGYYKVVEHINVVDSDNLFEVNV